MAEILFDLALEVAATLIVEKIPLIEGENESTTRLENEINDLEVLNADRLGDIDENNSDLRLFESGSGAKCGVEVGTLGEIDATTDTRSVNESPVFAGDLDLLVDRVASGAGKVVDDDTLFTGGLVEKARLAHVRPTENGDTSWPTNLFFGNRRNLRKNGHHLVEQIRNTTTVKCRNRPRLAQTEAPENGCVGLLPRVIHLVGDEDDRLLRCAKHTNDVLVGRSGANRRIHDEENGIGEIDSDLGLGGNRRVDSASIGLPAAGVDDGEAAVVPFAPCS